MEHSVCKQLVIGLPGTGKTTFLAALYHVVEHGEIAGALKLDKYEGNHAHVNRIRRKWANCETMDRTVQDTEEFIRMILKDTESEETTQVIFPDISGEIFNSHFNDRKWALSYDGLVNEANGALLFIHPDKIKEPATITEADHLVSEIGTEESSEAEARHDDYSRWDSDKACTQVKMVEILQFIKYRLSYRFNLKIALIISAWDKVDDLRQSPNVWLAKRLSLLEQYIKANNNYFISSVYGVSAQGGDYATDRDTLLHEEDPVNRIRVISDDGQSNDLTAPVKWIMQRS